MALPEQLADFEQRLATRFADAVEQVRRELARRVERATSDLSAELATYAPPPPRELWSAEELTALAGPSREAVRREFAAALLAALGAIDRASSQRGVLEELLAASRGFADRAALWLTHDKEMLGWGSAGFAGDALHGLTLAYDALPCLTGLAGGTGVVRIAGAEAVQLASALEIAAPSLAAFIPLVLRDRIAAALYVDRVGADELEVAALQLLVYAAAQRIELQGLSTRDSTPTLTLAGAEGVAGLPLWAPPALPPEPAAEEIAAEPAAEPATPADVAAGAPATFAAPEAEPPAAEAVEPESETLAESMPTMRLPAFAPPAEETPSPSAEPTPSEISWQLEEAAETTVFLGTVPTEDEAPGAAPAEVAPPLVEVAPPATEAAGEPTPPATPEEATAPHQLPWYAAPPAAAESPAATHEVAPPPSLATTAIPAVEPDLSEDATVLVRPAGFGAAPTAPVAAPTPVAPPPSEPVEDQTHPSLSGPGIPPEERAAPRGARTTEVAPPPDLQGPGWAFTTSRLPRAGGESALHEEARRLARLLVSEIKLYNEEQVEEGRRNRDVYHRLKDDIDRSRQIYEERIHESVRESSDYFQQELVRSLAGGDPRALGI